LINRGGRNFEEFPQDLWRKIPKELLIRANPMRNGLFETLGADEIGGNPDFFQCLEKIRMLVLGFGTWFMFRLSASGGLKVSAPTDGIFAVETKIGTDFIEDLRFLLSRSFLIT